jgi:hypothetical protein
MVEPRRGKVLDNRPPVPVKLPLDEIIQILLDVSPGRPDRIGTE